MTRDAVSPSLARLGHLPAYLRDIEQILVDHEMADSTMATRARAALPGVPERVLAGESRDHRPAAAEVSGQSLYLKHYKGRFLRFCPGTSHYRCCGYRIAHIGENCPIGCAYCILQSYFQDRTLKSWANQSDLFFELDRAFAGSPDTRFRVGTGEFTDSLVLEPITRYGRDLAAFCAGYDNVCLEFKSKIVDLSWLDAARPDRTLPAWSVNSPEITALEEGACAGLEDRLRAARYCADRGFRVCLHFDPIIRYPGWEAGYDQTADMILDYLRPEDIAYISLGSFRFMPELARTIAARHPRATYIYDEFITGLDGKRRLLRPLRVEQFRRLVSRLRRGGLDEQLYFCMESDEVWRATLGRTPREFGGLAARLLDRAFMR